MERTAEAVPRPSVPPREHVRILRVITRINLGGPAHHVSLLSGRLDGRYDTLLLAGQVGPGEASAEELARRNGTHIELIAALRPEPRVRDDLKAVVALARAVRRFRPHIVHTHTAKAGFLGRLAAAYAVRPRPIIVHTFHGHVLDGYFGTTATNVYRSCERLAAGLSDALVGVSRSTVDDLVGLGVAPLSKFRVIPVGLDLDPFLKADRAAGDDFRRDLDAGGDTVATFVGRLVPIKRLDVALAAVAEARQQGAPLRLAIVGDGPLRLELEARARRLGIADVTRFLGYRRDTVSIAAGTDVALLTSANEGLPVWLVEAGASGRPAVATDVGGVAEVVQPGCGITVPVGDTRGLAAGLIRLASSPALRAEMGQRARDHVRQAYSADRLLADMDTLYSELIARRLGSQKSAEAGSALGSRA